MKRKMIAIGLCMVSLLALTACTASKETETSSETQSSSVETSTVSEESKEKIKTTKSTIDTPLSVETWSVCGKYCTATESYENVPIRITKIIRGDEANQKVKAFMEAHDGYDYTEPEDGKEWVVAVYEINLDNFTVEKAGADPSITARVCGTDGGNLVLNDEQYYATVLTLAEDKYVYDGTVEGMVAFVLPKALAEYRIVFGEYDEQCAYFSGV